MSDTPAGNSEPTTSTRTPKDGKAIFAAALSGAPSEPSPAAAPEHAPVDGAVPQGDHAQPVTRDPDTPQTAAESTKNDETADGKEAEPAQGQEEPQSLLADIERRLEEGRKARVAEREQKQQSEQTSQAQQAYEAKLREIEQREKMLASDPLNYAREHGIDPKGLLDTLVKQGALPEVDQVERELRKRLDEEARARAALEEQVRALRDEYSGYTQQQRYEANARVFRDTTNDDKSFPNLAALPSQSRDMWGNMAAERFQQAGIPFTIQECAAYAEKILGEHKAQLLGQTAAAATSAPKATDNPSDSSAHQPAKAAQGLTNDLAGQPAGQIPPPQTLEEKRAEMKRILSAG